MLIGCAESGSNLLSDYRVHGKVNSKSSISISDSIPRDGPLEMMHIVFY